MGDPKFTFCSKSITKPNLYKLKKNYSTHHTMDCKIPVSNLSISNCHHRRRNTRRKLTTRLTHPQKKVGIGLQTGICARHPCGHGGMQSQFRARLHLGSTISERFDPAHFLVGSQFLPAKSEQSPRRVITAGSSRTQDQYYNRSAVDDFRV